MQQEKRSQEPQNHASSGTPDCGNYPCVELKIPDRVTRPNCSTYAPKIITAPKQHKHLSNIKGAARKTRGQLLDKRVP